jgi:hypothetical protein
VRIGEREFVFVHQRGKRRASGWPFNHPLPSGHERQASLGLLAKQAEIRRRVADPEHTLAGSIAP